MLSVNNIFQLSIKRVMTIPCKLKQMGTAKIIKNQTTRNWRQFSTDNFGLFMLLQVWLPLQRTVCLHWCCICVYGSTFVVSLVSLPEESKHRGPVPFLLKNRWLITIAFAMMGIVAFSVNKYFLWRTITRIEIKADGRTVHFMALNRLPLSRTQYSFEVPLNHVSCIQARLNAKAPFVVIKIKGKRGSFYIDKEGLFPNPSLFDYSIGVNRKI
uniref:Transmembrane protein 223 n=1 Tax=Tetranychus urticae TaxID=32264 RepID=T1L505_TETUR